MQRDSTRPLKKTSKPRSINQFKVLRLDRYVLMEVLGPFLGGVVFLTFVFLMFKSLQLAEFLIVHNIPGELVLKMTYLLTLSFMPVTLPIALLIAVLVGFGRLSADSELVAMKACGISVLRLSAPIILMAVFVALLSLMLNLEWVPWGQREFRKLHVKIGNTKIASSIQEGTFTSGFFDLLIFADKVDAKTKRLERVFIYDEREPKNPLTVIAKEGELVPVDIGTELGAAVMMRLFKGNIHSSQPNSETYERIDFDRYRLYLELGEGEESGEIRKPRMLSFDRLTQEIQGLSPHEDRARKLSTEYWTRLSVPLLPVIFVFLGIGYGTIRTRSPRSGAALIATLVLVSYYLTLMAATSLAQNGSLPPFLSMQIPNLFMMVVAIIGFRKIMH